MIFMTTCDKCGELIELEINDGFRGNFDFDCDCGATNSDEITGEKEWSMEDILDL